MPYTYEQFLQVKNQNVNRLYLSFFAENMQDIAKALDDRYVMIDGDVKRKLKEKLPGYVNAISTIMGDQLTKESYDNAMHALADFPAFLSTNLYGQSYFQRVWDLARQKLILVSSNDLADSLAAFDKLTDLGLKDVPQVRNAYRRVKDVQPPDPQPQVNEPEQQAQNDNGQIAGNDNIVNENNEIVNENQAQNEIPNEAQNEIPNEQPGQNEQPEQNEVHAPEQPPVQQPVPVPPAPAPLRGQAAEEAANRLKTHLRGVANGIPGNVRANSLSGDMKQKLPQFADAIAVLGTDGQPEETYAQAKNTLQGMRELLLRLGTNGVLGYEHVTNKCGRIDGGSPSEESLMNDLQALNGILGLGLENMNEALAAQRSLRGRKIDELRFASKPFDNNSLTKVSENPAQRTALEHLNALYATLSNYDNAHPQAQQFTQLRSYLNDVRTSITTGGDAKNVNNLLRNGKMATELLNASNLLQDENQTITQGLNKAVARDQLQRAAAALQIMPAGLVPENVRDEVRNFENAYIERREAQLQAEERQTRTARDRFGADLDFNTRIETALYNAADRITNANFPGKNADAKMNGMLGLCSLITILQSRPGAEAQFLNGEEATRVANELAANQSFTNLVSQNMDEMREAIVRGSVDGAIKFLQKKQLEMERVPEDLPEAFMPTALGLTESRIRAAKDPGFRNKTPEEKVNTLAQILAAREVVGSTRGEKETLNAQMSKKFFARTREIEQSKSFRKFVELNEPAITRSLQGRTHGGAMEDLYKAYVKKLPHIPDNIPARFMPTALERIDGLKKTIDSRGFREMSPAQQKAVYAELMATRLAVNSTRGMKSSLNFVVSGEALAKAREQILSDPDMVRALGDREMRAAALSGHGGHMEEIAARYNLTNPLKENLDPRYQPTAKDWINYQVRALANTANPMNPVSREEAAARVFATLEAYGNDLNVRIGQAGPSVKELNDRAAALANDPVFKNICAHGGLPTTQELDASRNPLRMMKNAFQTGLNAAQQKPLNNSFTRLSPARPPQPRSNRPAPNEQVDPEAHFRKAKELMTRHNNPGNNQNRAYWADLNTRTIQRSLAEISACATLQNEHPNEPVTVQSLQAASTKLMESKSWQEFFAQQSPQQLQELLVNAESRNQAIQQIADSVHPAQAAVNGPGLQGHQPVVNAQPVVNQQQEPAAAIPN